MLSQSLAPSSHLFLHLLIPFRRLSPLSGSLSGIEVHHRCFLFYLLLFMFYVLLPTARTTPVRMSKAFYSSCTAADAIVCNVDVGTHVT